MLGVESGQLVPASPSRGRESPPRSPASCLSLPDGLFTSCRKLWCGQSAELLTVVFIPGLGAAFSASVKVWRGYSFPDFIFSGKPILSGERGGEAEMVCSSLHCC